MTDAITIPLMRLAAGYLFVAIVLALAARWRIGRTWEIVVATMRMTVQLIAVGYLLDYLFEWPSPWVTILVVLLMETFAVRNIFARVRVSTPARLRLVISGSLVVGTVTPILFFVLVIVGLQPWYEPRYFISIAGMLIGNSMTGIALGYDRLASAIRANADRITAALMLGATDALAAKGYAREAFAAAIMPTINSMVGMGIVFLPGMMTGQILSGSSPILAVRYQIAIMLGILASVTITVFLMTSIGYRTFFTKDLTLVDEGEGT